MNEQTTVSICFPPGTRSIALYGERKKFGTKYTVKRWFEDQRRLARFIHLLELFDVTYKSDRPIQRSLL